MFDIDDDDEREKDDFFESAPPEDQPKPQRQPTPKPDEPDYWEAEESEWEHLRPKRRWRTILYLAAALAALGVMIGLYIRYFSPCEEDAVQYGYVEKINSAGTLFTTYEGTLLPYREMMDTTRVYREDFLFSVKTDSVAASLKRLERKGVPVRLEYDRYHAAVPWRGATTVIVKSVEEADPSRILPPEFRPEYRGTTSVAPADTLTAP